jgi:hypothetical protein
MPAEWKSVALFDAIRQIGDLAAFDMSALSLALPNIGFPHHPRPWYRFCGTQDAQEDRGQRRFSRQSGIVCLLMVCIAFLLPVTTDS